MATSAFRGRSEETVGSVVVQRARMNNLVVSGKLKCGEERMVVGKRLISCGGEEAFARIR